MKKYLLCIAMCVTVMTYGQNDTTAIITVLAGNSLQFNFNSYKKMQTGIGAPYSTGWTRLRTQYRVTDGGSTPNVLPTNWKLSVKSAMPNIVCDDGTTTLALSTIRVRAVGTGITSSGWKLLSNIDEIIAEGSSDNAVVITVSYECGIPPACTTIMGKSPGYYFGDLIFTISKK